MNRTRETQLSLFEEYTQPVMKKTVKKTLTDSDIAKYANYTLEQYTADVEQNGLAQTWNLLCDYALIYGENNQLLQVKNFGELYEIGLAVQDKILKKKNGQYYTPDDVATVMSKWLLSLPGSNVCDVGCGTGKLILTYLSLLGESDAKKLISEGRLYLYDLDETALKICKTSLALIYGREISNKIHDVVCDFLDASVHLPEDCKVISNPPYASISNLEDYWGPSNVIRDSMELYSSFMEKEFAESVSTVVITPFSFISSHKFFSLRKEMCEEGHGFIVAFDNVPGNIFCGRKKGIFNTNTANSVRASITVYTQGNPETGYRVTPLIRFKSTERAKLLQTEVLESFLPEKGQIINSSNTMFRKVDKRVEKLFNAWIEKSNDTFLSLLDDVGEYVLAMPNTCRYFTVASNAPMKRNGQIILRFSDPDKFYYAYCLINSSFVYWHWRIYDGGITYPKGLLEEMPVFFDSLSDDERLFFRNTAKDMLKEAKNFVITKNNVGTQENIKFPRKYRDLINREIIHILGQDQNEKDLDVVHSNMALEVNV